jgi:hypothetical protein
VIGERDHGALPALAQVGIFAGRWPVTKKIQRLIVLAQFGLGRSRATLL